MKFPRVPGAVVATVYVAYAYVGSEWLFFATKASFMTSLSSFEQASSALTTPFPLALGAALVCWGLCAIRRSLGAIVPTVLFACMLMLLIDNFAYTVLGWGIVRSEGITRWPLLLVFLGLGWQSFVWSGEAVAWIEAAPRKHVGVAGAILALSAFLGLGILIGADASLASAHVKPTVADAERDFDVIFLATDGLEARRMSLYGYPLDTTPFLRRLASESMLFENAFSNAGKTTGSTTSMLSGKTPAHVKVGFPPQVLPRDHSFQHLPGILRQRGYRGVQFTTRHYADAADLNMQGAFDFANDRDLWAPVPGSTAAWLTYAWNAEFQLGNRVIERVVTRLLHISGLRDMINHYLLVAENKGLSREFDTRILESAKSFIEAQEGPYVAHLHLMSTHCCKFRGVYPFFKPSEFRGLSPENAEFAARMHSAIREADGLMGGFVAWLRTTGRLERTILIVTSDHTSRWESTQRVPFMIRFPDGAHAQRVSRNAELVDIPATVLDYLKLERPAWMSSRSLLAPDPGLRATEAELSLDGHRPILSLDQFVYKRFGLADGGLSRMESPGPPHYGVKDVSLILCNRWYRLNLAKRELRAGNVDGHSAPCDTARFPTPERVRDWIERELEGEGFVIDRSDVRQAANPR